MAADRETTSLIDVVDAVHSAFIHSDEYILTTETIRAACPFPAPSVDFALGRMLDAGVIRCADNEDDPIRGDDPVTTWWRMGDGDYDEWLETTARVACAAAAGSADHG